MNGISDQTPPKPDWQVALEHHEALCAERTERIYREIQLMRENMKEMREDMKGIREDMRGGLQEMREDMRGNLQEMREDRKEMREEMRDDFKTIREEIRELRTGQRWIIGIVAGAMLAWPPLLLAAIHLLA